MLSNFSEHFCLSSQGSVREAMVAVSLTRQVETHHMLLAALVELLVSAMHSKKVRQFTLLIFFKNSQSIQK
jgi:uncharacterized protein (UPF0303 family)